MTSVSTGALSEVSAVSSHVFMLLLWSHLMLLVARLMPGPAIPAGLVLSSSWDRLDLGLECFGDFF